MTDPRQHYVSRYEQHRERLRKLGSERLRRLRDSAIERFGELGFPTAKNEEWKYTNLAPMFAVPFEPAARNGVPSERVASLVAGLEGIRLVFVNGHFEPALSSVRGLPEGVLVTDLGTALAGNSDILEAHLGQHALHKSSALTALNTSLMEDGALVYLPRETVLPSPLYLVFASAEPASGKMSHPRTLIVAGPGSQATVVEAYVGRGEDAYLTNAVTELVLEERSHLEHYRLQVEGAGAFHIGLVQVSQARDSELNSHLFSLGASLARNEVRTILGAEGSSCALRGLYIGSGRQHLDNLTLIDHAMPRCTSRELYKGILDDRATGVFSGRIRVHPDAQKTDASQTNKNLLLSEDAIVDTKPQLEIFADDVKCTHGAAVGQLDEDAIFYLRSRGVGREDARRLLTYAFASEMVDLVRVDPLKDRIQQLVTGRLPGGRPVMETA